MFLITVFFSWHKECLNSYSDHVKNFKQVVVLIYLFIFNYHTCFHAGLPSHRVPTHYQNVNYWGTILATLTVPRAISQFIRKDWELCSWAHCHTLPSLRLCFSHPPPSFFSFLLFFCSHAAARRQEQHEQTGFLSLAAFIHLPKSTSFPPLRFFFFLNQLMIISIQNGCNVGQHWPNQS